MSRAETPLAALGLCQGCERLVDMSTLPMDAMNAEWRCGTCEIKLAHSSFGYEQDEAGEWKRLKWVGIDGKWTTEKPTEDFTLGTVFVRATKPPTAL